MAFAGTTQKCMACDKIVYLVDKLTADNRVFHKACFRCHHCKGTLKLSNYNSSEGVLYCKPHFDQLFKRTGSLDKSFEGTPKIAKPEKNMNEVINPNSSNLQCTTEQSVFQHLSKFLAVLIRNLQQPKSRVCFVEQGTDVLVVKKRCTPLRRY
ncbi:hypothetical protein Fmac_032321 [Flemingia macrophylla]|uniref:LIM zinc-binding domain-containing protein n=1 Tax=Flemingia macrophylla TaxID=520843 RepID=A0ABD1L4L2_9FABA